MAPPAPKYAPGSVVYMLESASSIGAIDALKIRTLRYDGNEYLYLFEMGPRPGITATVGDRIDLRTRTEFELPESALITLCEALALAVTTLRRRVINARNRFNSLCPGTDSGSVAESPKYDVDDTVYTRQSAAQTGILEAVIITRFSFSTERGQYYYRYKMGIAGKETPFEVPESELVALCDALPLQIAVLEKRLADVESKYAGFCGGTSA